RLQQVMCLPYKTCKLRTGPFDAMQSDKGRLSRNGGLPCRLAERRAVGCDVEKIVRQLKGKADRGTEVTETFPVRFARSCGDGTGLTGKADQCAGFHGLQPDDAGLIRIRALRLDVEGLPADHPSDTGRP